MSDETVKRIGKVIKGDADKDAVHIAVFPAVAGEDLYRGQDVTLKDGVATTVEPPHRLGVVDPFLRKGYVKKGSRVWVFMNPGSITGLRHEWTHPMAVSVPTEDHEKWIRDFAERWNFDYDSLISNATARGGKEWDHYIVANGINLHSAEELGDDHGLFWYHLEGLTGDTYSEEHREKFGWSCSC